MPETDIAAVIDGWRDQVLDLTRRNDLVDFTATKSRSLPLSAKPIDIAELLRQEGEVPLGKQSCQSPCVDREPSAAADSLTELRTRHRQYRRERGVDALYLSLGRLHWTPDPSGKETLASPLFLLPVDLERRPASGTNAHDYAITGEEASIQLNPALRKKLDAERGLDLFEDKPVEGTEFDGAFERADAVAASFNEWSVSRDVALCLFDFTNVSIYEDLERNRSALQDDPHVRAIAGDHGAIDAPTDDGNEDATSDTGGDKGASATGTETTDGPSEDEGPADESNDSPAQATQEGRQGESEHPYQVLEADPSQRRAIDAAVRGESFVLEGPPGTGKSQTIANIVAEKLGRGESVLFVSEKQAALDVVQSRLSTVDLGRFCLEVHGQQATRESVLSAIESVEHVDDVSPPAAMDDALDRREDVASSLRTYTDLLTDSPEGFDTTVFEALGIISRLSDLPDFDAGLDDPLSTDQSAVNEAVRALGELATYEDPIRNVDSHPWRHATLETWRVDTGERMRRSIEDQIDALETLQSLTERLDDQYGIMLSRPGEIPDALDVLGRLGFLPRDQWDRNLFEHGFRSDRVRELAEAHLERERLRSELTERYETTLFSENGGRVHRRLSQYGPLRYVRPSYYGLKRQLTSHARPDYDPTVSELRHDARKLRRLQALESVVADSDVDERYLAPFEEGGEIDWERLLGVHDYLRTTFQRDVCRSEAAVEIADEQRSALVEQYRALRTAAQSLEAARAFFREAMAIGDLSLDGTPFETATFEQQRAVLDTLRSNLDRLQDWVQFTRCREAAAETLAGVYVQSFLDSNAEPSLLVDGFRREFYRAWLNAVYERTPLSTFSRSEFDHRLETYREADEAVIDAASAAVRHAVTNQLPDRERDGPASDQAVVLRRELRKQRHRRPLRELFATAGDAIKQRTPCFMMSPRMVAQCLPYDDITFDTVVFDEASQIPPAEAASALLRADQVIVAGDPKQLPPTRFFESDIASETDLESVLDEASAVLPTRTLAWHYRSRSPSLIEFSNKQYYDGRLRAFPERSEAAGSALSFEYVADGVYRRGESRTNPVEAERVADIVTEHAENRPDTSLGVVAFSRAQERAIRSELSDRRAENPRLDAFLARDDVQEEPFVKSLEVVQGDERDRIVFSVGYGPDPDGELTMNFGPLNQSSGHRRLNVAITRARHEVTVVTSITPEEIEVSATASRGVADFKRYLTSVRDADERHETGLSSGEADPTDEWPAPLVADVYQRLTTAGVPVTTPDDCAGYTFDMVIFDPADPEVPLLGIQVDGTLTRRCASTRDRDRLRQAVLADRGWPIHRVWAPSWATDTEHELSRLCDRVMRMSDNEGDQLSTRSSARDVTTTQPGGGR